MSHIIPRNLIKHLEWTPSKNPAPTPHRSAPQHSRQDVSVKSELSKYIQVGINGIHGSPVLISPFELENFNNMDYDTTHSKLLDNGLYMPTPTIFMTYFNNVVEASKGSRTLLYADGTEVPKKLATDMYKHLTSDFKDVYDTGNSGVWTWLNARFVKGEGFNGLDLETVVRTEGKRKDLVVRRDKLEPCNWADELVTLSFNPQGLAIPGSTSKKQSYSKGNNIYFWHPREDAVARFDAYSGGANLDCDWVPSDTNSSLGVFGCAEGALAQKKGESSS